jgi:hypothetical protein
MRSALSIVFVGLSGLALVGCGGGGQDGPPFGGGGTGGVVTLDCTTLTDPPPDCQKACTSDSQCEASFCSNGSCLALCTQEPAEGCGANSTCNSRGRCVPNIGTGGTGGSGNTGGSGCQSVQVTPTRSIPNVMFLVDQSGSMTANFSGQERWTAAHTAITDIISELDSIVRFGLTTYQSNDGGPTPAACPIFDTQVGFAMNNFGAINMSFPASFPGGEDTPTGDSIDVLVDLIQADPPPAEGPTIIVLATDGEPDTCEIPDPNPTPAAHAEAIAAAQNAFQNADIRTFILSVGNDVSDAHLQEMANAGTGLAPNGSEGDADFWKATTPQGLEDAFNAIIGASISCDIQMDKQFDDKVKACADGDVRLNGNPLSCPADWRVKPGVDDVIELVGSACDTFKSGDVTFTASFPCGAIVVE